MRVESSQMLPFDNVSRPARQLSAVDLPQPDGPSRAMNSPRRTFSVTPLSALMLPKLRLMPSSLSSWKSRAAITMMNRPPRTNPTQEEDWQRPPSLVGATLVVALLPADEMRKPGRPQGSPPHEAAGFFVTCLILLLRADLLVPAGQGIDELVGQQRQFLLVVGDRRSI